MLSLRGRSKAKKKSAQERDSMCPMMETEMRRLRGSSEEEEEEYEEYEEEEEEEGRSWGSGRSQATSSKENLWLQRGLLLSGSGESFPGVEEEEEEESEVKATSLQRWSDVCRGGGVKAEPRTEERIKLQLFSGVC